MGYHDMSLLLILVFAALNRAAGYDPIEDYAKERNTSIEHAWDIAPDWRRWAKYATDKFVCAVYAGLLVAGLSWIQGGIVMAIGLGLATAVGFAFWRLFGWGAMFHAFNGEPYEGTGVLSKFVGAFLGHNPQAAAVLYGGLRGGLGIIPWAAGVGYHDVPAGLALLVAGLSMGGIYWLGGIHQRATRKDTGIKISEVLFGAVLGACMAVAIW